MNTSPHYRKKVSVAMATFNGSRYLSTQLASLAAQEQLPDELVVVDDLSTDNTLEILQDFQATAPFSVKILKNKSNLGHELTFSRALESCSGDIIFLCDQDDEWFPSKIKYMCKVLADNPSIKLVICDAVITDQYLSPTTETVLSRLSRNFMLDSEYKAHNLGCAIAVSKSIMPLLLPIRKISGDALNYGHDTLLNEICCAINSRIVIKKPLQYYRRHLDAATIPDHTVVGSISSTNIKLSDHLNRSPALSLEYLKRLHALHLLIYRFMDYYSHEQPMLDNAQIFSISNLAKFIEYMSSVCHRMELIMETSLTKRLYLATAMMVSGKYKAFYGLRSYIFDLITLCRPRPLSRKS